MFQDRAQAARFLAQRLKAYARKPNTIVLGLPRGGAPMARTVADELHLPFDIYLVRKIGAPTQPELALGALAEGGIRILDQNLANQLGVTDADIERLTRMAQLELDRRGSAYRGGRLPPAVHHKTVILVDDGIATGSTMTAAIRAARLGGAAHIVVAIPVAPPATYRQLRKEVDEVICAETHEPFYSVGTWYHNFPQLEDADVIAALTPPHQSASAD